MSSSSAFTQEEQQLIEFANQAGSLLGHHHHHHGHHDHAHHQPQFKAPTKLTTEIGLYALKKLNAIDPKLLTVRQARLLEPVTPGPLTYFAYGAWYMTIGFYATYLWRTRGPRGFLTFGVLPYLGLVAAKYADLEAINYFREFTYSSDRKKLVQSFANRYGEQYLLNVLNPAFRI